MNIKMLSFIMKSPSLVIFMFLSKELSLLPCVNALEKDIQTTTSKHSIFNSRRNLRGQPSNVVPLPSFDNESPPTDNDISNGEPTFASNSGFKITLMHMGTDTTYNAIFENAARKWERIIVGDLPDIPRQSSSSHSWFGSDFDRKVNIDIDDVLIGYEMEEVDGRGGVLGYAGPVYKRSDDNAVSAISGIMKFDKDDFANMSNDDIQLVIIHEMGHVLGIGTFWGYRCGTKCESGKPSYTCDKAKSEYKALGYSDDLQIQPDVCGHWSESNFGFARDEIMTPYFDEGKFQPLSRITAAALADLGYQVDFRAADSWARNDRLMMAESNETDAILPSKSFVIDETAIIKPKMMEFDPSL